MTAATYGKAYPGRRWSSLLGPAAILLCALAAVAPVLMHGQFRDGAWRCQFCGDDLEFHFVSWVDAQQSWRQGIAFPQWAQSPSFRAGEARFVFYPPLTWMLGASLGLVLPWTLAPAAMTFLLLAAAGLATKALAAEVLPPGPASLAGCAAIFSGYGLFCAYTRAAYGELAGGFWIPLILLFALRDRAPCGRLWERAFDGSSLPLALAVAGAWLSNAPVGVMACYALAGVALVSSALSRSWAFVLRAVAGVALGMLLAAVYVVPAAWERRWVAIEQAIDAPQMWIENNWLFAHNAARGLAGHDFELSHASWVAVAMLAVTFGSVLVAYRSGALPSKRVWWIPLSLIPVAILFLLLPISQPVWDGLPWLRFLQFPWRWLVVLQVPLAIFFACAVAPFARQRRILAAAACAAIFAAAIAAASWNFLRACIERESLPAVMAALQSGEGIFGTAEYAARGSDSRFAASGRPGACLVRNPMVRLGELRGFPSPVYRGLFWSVRTQAWYRSLQFVWEPQQGTCDATFDFSQDGVAHKRLDGVAGHAGFLILRLSRYPAWRIAVNGQAADASLVRQDGLTVVPVHAGPVHLAVDWTTTEDVAVGRVLSGVALVLLVTLWYFERTLRQRRHLLLAADRGDGLDESGADGGQQGSRAGDRGERGE